MSEDERDDFDDVPLQHKRPFGSGLRRGEIKFVPASTEDSEVTEQTDRKSKGQSISEFYLNMVLKTSQPTTRESSEAAETVAEAVCEICKLPLGSSLTVDGGKKNGKSSHHEASIVHQVCLAHSHPPSALDRSRMGLSVLEAQGWDPDSRTGLGAAGQGVHYPIKVKPKDKEDKLGIGVVVPKDFQAKKAKEPPKRLHAGKVRKMAAEDRRRTEKLQRQIFGRVDLEKYLGKGA